jgi:hypothetical protein
LFIYNILLAICSKLELSRLSRKYIDFLNEASSRYSDLLWYSTFLASKHRFYSGTKELQHLIFSGESSYRQKTPSKISRLAKSFLLLIKISIKKSLLCFSTLPNRSKNYESLIKTMSYSSSFEGDFFEDPFLGELSKKITQEQSSFIIVDHLGPFFRDYKKIRSFEGVFHFYQFLKWRDILIISLSILKKAFYKTKKYEDKSAQFIEDNFSNEIISHWSIFHLLYYKAFLNIFDSYKFSHLYSTYENNNWEKMMMLAKRECNSSFKVIAHQHVPISESALNYFPGTRELELLPDYIVTTGDIPRDILSSNIEADTTRFKEGCGLRFKKTSQSTANKDKIVLAALDGTEEAKVVLLFLYQNKDYLEQQGYAVIVRYHPIFGHKKMKPYLPFEIEKDTLWKISSVGLKEDLERSSIVSYWGSTVGFEALGNNKPIICVRGESEFLSNDPLWGIRYHKWHVTENDPIESIISEFEKGESYWPYHSDHFDLSLYFKDVSKENLENFFVK